MEDSLKTIGILSSIFSTKSKAQVKDLHFNVVLKVWLGTVSGVPHAWNSYGKCIDRTHPEYDLF
jgi:hypothetical protein